MKTELLDIRHADCMDLMREFPDNHFDLAVVDPPYGIGADGNDKSTGSHGGRKAYEQKGWDSATPDAGYFRELRRVSKNQIIWGANYYPQHLTPSMGWIAWDKGQRICSSDQELAFTSFQRALRVFTLNRCALAVDGTIHPTQKPVKLYDWIFANYAERGMEILDTHLGSGSIAIAAHYAGMKLTACELDADYYKAACERITRETAQTTLFD